MEPRAVHDDPGGALAEIGVEPPHPSVAPRPAQAGARLDDPAGARDVPRERLDDVHREFQPVGLFRIDVQAEAASRWQRHLEVGRDGLVDDETAASIRRAAQSVASEIPEEVRDTLTGWDAVIERYGADTLEFEVRGQTRSLPLVTQTLSGSRLPKVAAPAFGDWGDRVRWLGNENFPGSYPFTAGIYPLKRLDEDPTRMFAGEGTAEQTHRRFHYLSADMPAKRLSTAFDSVTLYGEDPGSRPDIWGKVGEAGVSICTVEDAEKLYAGFDLCDPKTSVSMTINGPAPMLLAFFFNAAARQQARRRMIEDGRLEAEPAQAFQPVVDGRDWEALEPLLGEGELLVQVHHLHLPVRIVAEDSVPTANAPSHRVFVGPVNEGRAVEIQRVAEATAEGIRKMGDLFDRGEVFLPGLLIASEAMTGAVEILEAALPQDKKQAKRAVIVIGTIEGDIHDIGKGIIVTMLRVHGYKVHDLGRDVPIDEFVKKAQELNADVVGSSAMMTTTQVGQKKLEAALKEAGLRDKVKTMVGGAVATDHWAKRIGADLFGETPQDTIDKLGEILD